MKARISHLHKTEAEWSKLSSWIPASGEFIIYDPDEDYNYARLKIGDGTTALQDLTFFIESAANAVLNAHRYSEIIDAGRITDHKV